MRLSKLDIFSTSDRGTNSSQTRAVLAAALLVAGRVVTLPEGVALARQSIDSGAALAKVRGLARVSQGG